MSLLSRSFPAPLHVDISSGAINRLHEIVHDARVAPDARVAVLISTGSGLAFREQIVQQMPSAAMFEISNLNVAGLEEIANQLANFSSVVGVGGGRVLDAAKFVATKVGLPMVAVATNLAHDGIASPVSVLELDGRRSSHGVDVPAAVVIDLNVVRTGPSRFLTAGIGDVLSNLSAVADWELAREINGEEVDGLAAAMARTASTSLINHPGTVADDSFLTTLAEGLVLSGLAMAVAGTSRPCSGACHETSHSIDSLFPERSAPHGEQVALGALFATHVRGAKRDFVQMLAVMRRHSLPVSPLDLGLSVEEFTEAIFHAPQTRPDRFTILEHLDMTREQCGAAVAEFMYAL